MKILVVDDELIVARALSRAFSARGHDVTVAHSGEEGLEKWIENSPDAVMLDVVMPGLTGPQVIEEYKKRINLKTHARVILMTAHSGVKGLEPALELGADDFIQKPFENIFNLVTRIENLVRSE
jgi:DNA-binding response OmpR family regulator